MNIDSRNRWAQTLRRAGDEWIVSLPQRTGLLAFASLATVVPFDEFYARTQL